MVAELRRSRAGARPWGYWISSALPLSWLRQSLLREGLGCRGTGQEGCHGPYSLLFSELGGPRPGSSRGVLGPGLWLVTGLSWVGTEGKGTHCCGFKPMSGGHLPAPSWCAGRLGREFRHSGGSWASEVSWAGGCQART